MQRGERAGAGTAGIVVDVERHIVGARASARASADFARIVNRKHTERLTAYQLGYRGQPVDGVSMNVTGFYNVYGELRTVEPHSATTFLPITWGNGMRGNTFGIEAWADWQVLDWWRLSPQLTVVHKRLRFDPGASGLLGLAQAGDDPKTQAGLRSSMDLGHRVSVDAALRYTSALADPALAAYVEADVRLGWRLSAHCDVSLQGWNLLHAHHLEFAAPVGESIDRKVLAEARWRY